MVRPRAAARSLALALDAPPDIPPVAADPERLHQILDNLLDNAVKYAREATTITVMAGVSGDGVETTVSNAVATQPPDPERMFERFYRADPSKSGAAGGVGLGLSISRELATAMGGRLLADFVPEGELRLHLLLPTAAQSQRAPEPSPEPAPARSKP